MVEKIIYACVGLLVPMVPALIIYKFLPSKTIVSGPFKSWDIKIVGPFGGYLILVVLVMGYFFMGPKYELWKVTGTLGDPQAGGTFDRSVVNLYVRPPIDNMIVNEGRTFVLDLPLPSGFSLSAFPTLVIEYPEHETVNIPLNGKQQPFSQQYEVKHDRLSKEIEIQTLIPLEECQEPYQP